MKKRIIITIMILITISLVAWKVYPYLTVFRTDEPIEFSYEAWNKDVYDRGPMLDDLLKRYDFVGMSKEEVVALLGTNGIDIGEKSLRYETGSGYFKDEILSFTLDENGKVEKVGIAN